MVNRYQLTSLSFGFLLSCLTFANLPISLFPDGIFDSVEQEYGEEAKSRVQSWQLLINDYQDTDDNEKLQQVNRFFNEVRFVDDIRVWQQNDYWATPIEFLGKNAGDCEDFTIAKYFTLTAMGIAPDKLRLMYVQALRLKQAHMVLAYFETPEAMPLILDNINKHILPANLRRDLKPVYSFNGDGLWAAKAQGRGKKLRNNSHGMWETMLNRINQGQ